MKRINHTDLYKILTKRNKLTPTQIWIRIYILAIITGFVLAGMCIIKEALIR